MANQTYLTDRAGRRQLSLGARVLGAAVVLYVVGFVLIVLGSGFADFAGIVLAAIATPPALIGLGLLFAGVVARWSAAGRPFA